LCKRARGEGGVGEGVPAAEAAHEADDDGDEDDGTSRNGSGGLPRE
jgi:hypothetical protein